MMRRVFLALALAASAAFFMAAPRLALASGTVGQTFTVPQCLVAAAGQDLMADTASADDCLFGTTGGPF